MREDNRRQTLHWALQLVEAALLEHPSEGWEKAKARQTEFMAAVLPAGSGGESPAAVYAASEAP
jgi:hypothetical protein